MAVVSVFALALVCVVIGVTGVAALLWLVLAHLRTDEQETPHAT